MNSTNRLSNGPRSGALTTTTSIHLTMSKEKTVQKEAKKEATKSLKEKRAEKKAKKGSKYKD